MKALQVNFLHTPKATTFGPKKPPTPEET